MRVLAESHVDEDGGDLDLLERGARVECTASRRADEGKEDEDGGGLRELSSSAAIESDGQTLIRIASHVPFTQIIARVAASTAVGSALIV